MLFHGDGRCEGDFQILYFVVLLFCCVACRNLAVAEQKITVVAVGDIIFHGDLHKQAYQMGSHHQPNFKPLWKLVSEHIFFADIAYGNLEGPSFPDQAYSDDVAGKSIKFNFHPAGIKQLQNTGFDVFSTANNHILDQGSIGLDATLEILEQSGVLETGTRSKVETSFDFSNTVAIIEKKGVSLAFISCTHTLNGRVDKHRQVLKCYKGKKANTDLLKLIRFTSQRLDVDGVIVTPHWGHEYQKVHPAQKSLARNFIDYGAIAVIGHHPHILQKHEFYKEKPIFYSLGNFISNQFPQNRTYQKKYKGKTYKRRHHNRLPRRTSVMLYLEVEKTVEKNFSQAKIANFKVMPIYMKMGGPSYGAEGNRFFSDLYGEDNGENNGEDISGWRTLVPLYIKKYTGLSEEHPTLRGFNFSAPFSDLPNDRVRRVVTNGSYTMAQNMKLAQDIVEDIFPKSLWLSEEEVDNPTKIFLRDN